MIENIAALITNRKNGRRKKIDIIDNRSQSIEEAKAKVQAILDSGAIKRKKIKKYRKTKE